LAPSILIKLALVRTISKAEINLVGVKKNIME